MKTLTLRTIFFLKQETVLCISGIAAIVTMLFVLPSASYLSYIDFPVLALLLSLMLVMAGLQKIGLFMKLSEGLLSLVVGLRSLSYVLAMLCFFSSMWITNDVALITFVPFTIILLNLTGKQRFMIRLIVLETIAANLGSMLTPVGNPQNLYLYSYYHLSMNEFIKITAPYLLISFFLLSIAALTIKKESLQIKLSQETQDLKSNQHLLFMYGLQFIICLLCVLRLVDFRAMLIIVLASTLIFDRGIFKEVDYSLLLTFICFFIFVGNIGHIPAVKAFLTQIMENREYLVTIITSQVISNVPAAVLLSRFTSKYELLILGANIGGLGTLIASLASLISYKFYCKTKNAKPFRYLAEFTAFNLLFLGVLCGMYVLLTK